jgi:hypothetical protein
VSFTHQEDLVFSERAGVDVRLRGEWMVLW